VPTGDDKRLYQQTFVNNLRYASERFAPHNIKILIEALNSTLKPHYLFSSQYQTLEIVKEINRDNVFTQFDFYHAQLMDGNLSHLIRHYAGCYAHIQIASVPDRHEPDEGELNYPYLFELLDSVGYHGWIGCEYNPRGDTLAGLGWFDAYKK